MTQTEKAGRIRLHDHVVKQLALHILRDEPLVPDIDCPTEKQIGEYFRVSRTVVREAIKVLEAKGLVETRPKRGVVVLPRPEWNLVDPAILAWQSEILPDKDFIRDLVEFRRAIEPVAAELAARRADPEDIERLTVGLAKMEAAAERRDEFITADLEFHGAIFTACHNELLKRVNSTVHGVLRASRVITTAKSGSSASSLSLHRDVANAIRAHDSLAARFAMDALISRTALDIEAVLQGVEEIELVKVPLP